MNSYQIKIFDHDLALVAVIDEASLIALSYDRLLNDVSAFAMTLDSSHSALSLIEPYYFLHINRKNPATGLWDDENSFVILFRESFTDQANITLYTIAGLSLECFLARRLIDPADDPLGANGYSTKSGAAETVMHEYVDEQIGNTASTERQLPNWNFDSYSGLGNSVGWRARLDNLLEVLQKLTTKGGIDFKVYLDIDASQIKFATGVFGNTRTRTNNASSYYLFSTKKGNIASPTLTEDFREEQNVIYALGAGQGDNRVILTDYSQDAKRTPYSWSEFIAEVSEGSDVNNLEIYTAMQKELADKRPTQQFSFILVNADEYRQQWDVGDRVTIEHNGYWQDMRITGVSIGLQPEDGYEVITPTLVSE